MNRVVITAQIVERQALRYTPAGLPALDLRIAHASQVQEAGAVRQVSVEMRRGRLVVRGTGTLEAAARTGESTSVRLAQTRVVVRGTLRASTVLVGETP